MKPNKFNLTKPKVSVMLGCFFALSICLTLSIGCKPSAEKTPPNETKKSGSEIEHASPKPASKSKDEVVINFEFFYRPTTDEATGDAKIIKIKVPTTEAAAKEVGFNHARTVEFGDLNYDVKATHNKLSIKVLTNAGKTVAKETYQFSGEVKNSFAPNGFTGLHFFYHPTTGAELQATAIVAD